MAADDADRDQSHHHGMGDTHGGEGNHGGDREVGGGNPHGKEDTHDEVDIRQRGEDTRDEKNDQAHHVDETHHESRNRSRAWGDMGGDAADGKSVPILVRHRDTRAHGGGIYARGQETLVRIRMDLDKERGKLEDQEDQGDLACHHVPEDREGQEGHYREKGWGEVAVEVVEVEAEAEEGGQMTAGEEAEAEDQGDQGDHPERACYGHERHGRQTQGQKTRCEAGNGHGRRVC